MAKRNSVTLSVADRAAVSKRFKAAMHGERQGSHISFATADLLWQVLTKKRWELIQTMTGAGGLSIREVARRVGRDFKGVHSDVQALLKAGVIDRQDDGTIVFPYDEIHVDFILKAA